MGIYTTATLLGTALGMTRRLSLMEWLAYALALLGIVPLIGYIRQQRHNPHWLWRLALYIGGFSLLLAASNLHAALDAGRKDAAAVEAARIVLTLPYLYALYRYLFRSPQLWR